MGDPRSWWIEGFTDGADPEYEEQILPLAAAELAGATRVLDVGCGDGQISRLAAALGADAVGIDPDMELRRAWQRGEAAPSFARAAAAALPFADASFDAVVACLVFEHIDEVDEAIAEVARVLQPGGRFCFFLNHPLLQTPEQRLDRRPGPRSARAVLADRRVSRRAAERRGGRQGRFHPVHPPAAEPLCERARRERPADRAHGGTGAPRRLPRTGQ